MHDQLREQVRVLAGRRPQPTAATIDSQSVKAADTVGKASRGYDAGKKTEGRKRHLAVDVMGLILAVVVSAASVQDRDGARPLLWKLAAAHRTITWSMIHIMAARLARRQAPAPHAPAPALAQIGATPAETPLQAA